MRAAPLARDVRPVTPGMEGGNYRVLSDADIQRVHLAALDVLVSLQLLWAQPDNYSIDALRPWLVAERMARSPGGCWTPCCKTRAFSLKG